MPLRWVGKVATTGLYIREKRLIISSGTLTLAAAQPQHPHCNSSARPEGMLMGQWCYGMLMLVVRYDDVT
jgi:hypothetical protein